MEVSFFTYEQWHGEWKYLLLLPRHLHDTSLVLFLCKGVCVCIYICIYSRVMDGQ